MRFLRSLIDIGRSPSFFFRTTRLRRLKKKRDPMGKGKVMGGPPRKRTEGGAGLDFDGIYDTVEKWAPRVGKAYKAYDEWVSGYLGLPKKNVPHTHKVGMSGNGYGTSRLTRKRRGPSRRRKSVGRRYKRKRVVRPRRSTLRRQSKRRQSATQRLKKLYPNPATIITENSIGQLIACTTGRQVHEIADWILDGVDLSYLCTIPSVPQTMSLLSTAIAQEATHCWLESAMMKCLFKNHTNAAVHFEVRTIKFRTDMALLNTAGTGTTNTFATQLALLLNSECNTTTAQDPTIMEYSIGDNRALRDCVRILKTEKVELLPGQEHTSICIIKPKRELKLTSDVGATTTNATTTQTSTLVTAGQNLLYNQMLWKRGWTHAFLTSHHGGLIYDSGNHGNITTCADDLARYSSQKYHVRYRMMNMPQHVMRANNIATSATGPTVENIAIGAAAALVV